MPTSHSSLKPSKAPIAASRATPKATPRPTEVWLDFKLRQAREAFNIVNPVQVGINASSVKALWASSSSSSSVSSVNSVSSASSVSNTMAKKMDLNAALKAAAETLREKRRTEEWRNAMRRGLVLMEIEEEFEKVKQEGMEGGCVRESCALEGGLGRSSGGGWKGKGEKAFKPNSILRRPKIA